MSTDVLNRSKQSAKFQFVYSVAAKAIGGAFSILLARVLLPDDYGQLTVAFLFTGLLTTLGEFGFQTFLIQHNSDDPKFAHTCFFIDISIAVCIGTILLGGSWTVGRYYDSHVLGLMLRLYAVCVVLNSIARVPIALLKKELNFRITAQAELTFTVSSQMFRLAFALLGLGAVSFPLGDIVGYLLRTSYIFMKTSFQPSLTLFSSVAARTIFSFGGNVMITSLGSFFATQVDKFLVSSRFPIQTIGYYNFGYSQPTQLFTLIVATQRDVFLSTYSKFKSDLVALRSIVFKVTSIANFIVLPIFGFAVLNASLIIEVIFTAKWLPSVLLFQLFCGDYIMRSFFSSITGIQLALGYAGRAARTKIVNALIFVIVMFCATFFHDITYYALGYLVSSFMCALHNLHANGKLIQLNSRAFICSFRSNVGSFLMTSICFYTIFDFDYGFQWNVQPLVLQLFCKGVVFILAYGIISYLFNRQTMLSLIKFVLRRQKG